MYFICSLFFRLGRLLPGDDRLVALISPHNSAVNDSLAAIKSELEKRGGYRFLAVSGAEIKGALGLSAVLRFYFVKAPALARAKYIFLNDNFMPLADFPLRKGTVVTQLWHGEGALKKICLALDLPDEIEKRERKLYAKYNWVVCSSESVVPVYSEAFGLPAEKILPLGSPRTDFFFSPFDYASSRAEFDRLYPDCAGKKLVLYAPTFRDDPEKDRLIAEHFDGERFTGEFGNEYALLVRFHPQVHSSSGIKCAADVTSYPDIGTLLRLSDALITDYSSVFMDFALLDKPCYFYAYDLEEYTADRDFYGDYRSIVPGPVAESFDELVSAFSDCRADSEKLRAFREYHMADCDGKSAERVVNAIILK